MVHFNATVTYAQDSLPAGRPVLGMVWVVRPIKFDDIFFLIRQRRRERLAGAKARQGLRLGGVSAAKASPDGLAVLAARRVYPAELGRVSLEIALRRHPAHANRSLSAHAVARGRRDRRRRHNSLDLIARSSDTLLLLVVLPLGVLLGRDHFTVDLVQVHHDF